MGHPYEYVYLVCDSSINSMSLIRNLYLDEAKVRILDSAYSLDRFRGTYKPLVYIPDGLWCYKTRRFRDEFIHIAKGRNAIILDVKY